MEHSLENENFNINNNFLFQQFLVIVYFIKNFVSNHPQLIYKSSCVVIVIYLIFPIINFIFQWLPWIWVFYEMYNRITITNLNFIVDQIKKFVTSRGIFDNDVVKVINKEQINE
jgi:hypothetical protein